MTEFGPQVTNKDNEREFTPPATPPQEMVPAPRWPDAAESIPDTSTPLRRRQFGKWVAGIVGGTVLLTGAGFLGAKLAREAEGTNNQPPKGPETTTSAPQAIGTVETTIPTQETRAGEYTEISPNTRVFAQNNIQTFNEVKNNLMDVSQSEALSVEEARKQFPVILRNAANVNTEPPAQDMRGGKDSLINFNKKLLPELLVDTGIQPGSDGYKIIQEFNTDNIKDGTYAQFKQEGDVIKAERYKTIGPNIAELVESKTFKVTGDPVPNAKLRVWEYPGLKLAEQKK